MAELRLEIEDGVAVVTMDNPPVNAASQEWDFQGVFASFYYNKDVRVAVLTGDGTRSFRAGRERARALAGEDGDADVLVVVEGVEDALEVPVSRRRVDGRVVHRDEGDAVLDLQS